MNSGLLKKMIPVLAFFGSIQVGYAQQQPKEQELKKNISPIENALAYVQQLEPKKFQYDTNRYSKLKLPNGQQYGFMAEDVQKVLPELVSSESQSYMVGKNRYQTTTLKNTDLESLIPILVGAIKEQQQQIEELKRQLKATHDQKPNN